MEEMKLGEQPIVQDHSAEAQQNFNNDKVNENETKSGLNETDGSSFGKFKDAKSLLEAYNSLEKEFTRKSQELSRVLKENQQEKLVKNNTEDKTNQFENENSPSQKSEASPTNEKSASENGEELVYKKPDWKSNVVDFFTAHPEAKTYAKEMSKVILANPSIAKSKDCLMLAYKLSLSEKFQEPAQLSKNEDFLKKYIIGNERAEQLIIDNYINSLKTRNVPPEVLTGKTTNVVATPPKKYASIKEAGEELRKMFN